MWKYLWAYELDQKEVTFFQQQQHPPPLFFCKCVSLPLPPLPLYPQLFFLKGDMGDPDVTFHWPMASREGLDRCALPMPPSFKNAWAAVSNSATQPTWERAAAPAASLTPDKNWRRYSRRRINFKFFICRGSQKKNLIIGDWRCGTMLELNKVALLVCFLASVALGQGK